MNAQPQTGLTLLEMAISILILGLMLAGGLTLYNSAADQRRERETREHMAIVIKALSNYVEAANRLPCPADPSIGKNYSIAGISQEAAFGWERGVRAQDIRVSGTRPVGDCNTIDDPRYREGIVPFQTLNIPYEATRDAWGNFFTYAVSPVFTRKTDYGDAGAEPHHLVHDRCREAGWVSLGDPVNAPKARFCCAQYTDGAAANENFPPATDLRIQLATDIGTDILAPRDVYPDHYGEIDNPLMQVGSNTRRPVNYAGNPTAPAFVLISHGRNGQGAFLTTDSGPPMQRNGVPTSSREKQNADLSQGTAPAPAPAEARLYYAGQQKFTGSDYFDDIVIWMTQDQIMAYTGTSSCRFP